MCGGFNKFFKGILVSYQAINDLIVGILCLIYTICYAQNDEINNKIGKNLLTFLLSIISIVYILKCGLLLYAIKKGHRKCLLIYLITTVVVLLVAVIFVIYHGIQMKNLENDISHTKEMEKFTTLLEQNFIFVYYIFFPFAFIFNSSVLFYVFLFYRDLQKHDMKQEANRQSIIQENVEFIK